ncbi:hypothetical protein M3Y97_00323300 [Aphelenchoides bicaudatus]|nr:hypothetical protein M3Y97_00323300 [Aphelenchoides bicaudatus]
MVLESEENMSPEQQEIRLLQQYVQETMNQVSGLYERNAALNRQVNELQSRHSTDSTNFRSTLEAKDGELAELKARGTQLKQELDNLKLTKQALHSELERYKEILNHGQAGDETSQPPTKTARYE